MKQIICILLCGASLCLQAQKASGGFATLGFGLKMTDVQSLHTQLKGEEFLGASLSNTGMTYGLNTAAYAVGKNLVFGFGGTGTKGTIMKSTNGNVTLRAIGTSYKIGYVLVQKPKHVLFPTIGYIQQLGYLTITNEKTTPIVLDARHAILEKSKGKFSRSVATLDMGANYMMQVSKFLYIGLDAGYRVGLNAGKWKYEGDDEEVQLKESTLSGFYAHINLGMGGLLGGKKKKNGA